MKNTIFRDALLVKCTAAVATTATILLLPMAQVNAATVVGDTVAEVNSGRTGVNFSGRLGLGYLTGEAHEYVYSTDDGKHTDSELIWDIDSVYMAGIGGSVQPLNWLNINADFWFNLDDGDGHMEDYDWVVVGMDWTDHSVHDNTDVTKAFVYDVNVEMTVFSTATTSFNGIVGYRHDAFEWEARGGSYRYSIDGFRDSSGTFPADELGITYEQSFDVPYFGVGFTGNLDRIHVAAKVIGSFFVSGDATDHHHTRDLVTYDDFSGESMFAFDIALGYDITNAIGITARYSYEKFDTMTGDSEWHFNDVGETTFVTDGAGADLETSLFSLNMTYFF